MEGGTPLFADYLLYPGAFPSVRHSADAAKAVDYHLGVYGGYGALYFAVCLPIAFPLPEVAR